MIRMGDIGYKNYAGVIPILGAFLENLYQYWWDDYATVADYVDFYIDGFSPNKLASMREEFVALGADQMDEVEVEAFLRRMNANHRVDAESGRQLLSQVGRRVAQLTEGAVPKHFD
ncbi:hypothetical protein [Curtobacterium flaccumfaciens]|uniref:hypothetical protein n=1 Tax=Curtobacterium flaccumfaciens TaxID=2035 RepID=UPI003EBFD36D